MMMNFDVINSKPRGPAPSAFFRNPKSSTLMNQRITLFNSFQVTKMSVIKRFSFSLSLGLSVGEAGVV